MNNYQHRVLCVDDDWDACEACQTISIFHPEVKFTFASDFEHGISFVRSGVFGLYLLGSWLPDGSGIDLCRAVRRADTNTPIAVFIRGAHASDRTEAMEVGASVCLDKPAALFHLENTVIGLLRGAEARSLEARVAEIRAVRNSIHDYLLRLDGLLEGNSERLIRANERLLRANAYSAFVDSGGARAHFESLWPSVFGEIVT